MRVQIAFDGVGEPCHEITVTLPGWTETAPDVEYGY